LLKILGLALYGSQAASTRYRLSQFAPGLKAAGIDLQVSALLGNEYLSKRFSGGGLPLSVMARDALARMQQLRVSDQFDAAIVHLELFPFVPGWVERALLRPAYVYDMDDAFYLRYTIGAKRLLKPLLGRKFETVLSGAAAITAGNKTLAHYSSQFNRNVTEIPTVVDVTRYVPRREKKRSVFTVGWIGSPSTATYLPWIVEPLARLGEEAPLEFVVIGGKAPKIPNVTVREIEWEEDKEVDLINTFDVGIMPLPDDPWARGKCAFKLIQYMACGVPVVASSVGANVDVVTPDCGYLVQTSAEWQDALRSLRDDPALRGRMGAAARDRIVEGYSLHKALPRLTEVLNRVAVV
jgi:glycosyltransferase involved in cell wall biosynthesis